MVFRLLFLIFGFIMSSSGIIFIKLGTLDPVFFASCRLLIASVILSPFFFRDLKKYQVKISFSEFKPSIVPGLFLGIHFLTWTYGARLAPAANAALIVNMLPVFMPLYSYFLISEKISVYEIIATALAISGVFILGFSDFRLESKFFAGDLISFFSMMAYVTYVALGRINRRTKSLWLYIVPLYLSGGLFCLVSYFLKGAGQLAEGPLLKEFMYVAGVVFFPTLMGHTIINYSVKYLKAQIVSVLNLLQAVFGAFYGYLFFSEIPGKAFYPASILILVSALIVILSSGAKKKEA